MLLKASRKTIFSILILTVYSVLASAAPLPMPKQVVHNNFFEPVLSNYFLTRLWKTWPRKEQDQYFKLTPSQRAQYTFERYGFILEGKRPIGLQREGGEYRPNCLMCHANRVRGEIIVGASNSRLDILSMRDDILAIAAAEGITYALPRYPFEFDPPATARGVSNGANWFSMKWISYRDLDMNVLSRPAVRADVHYLPSDAPAWWNVGVKNTWFETAVFPKTPRLLMFNSLALSNFAELFKSWEPLFKQIISWIDSLDPPVYEGPIDYSLAEKGKTFFASSCIKCHGNSQAPENYPNLAIPLDKIRTDREQALSVDNNLMNYIAEGWLNEYRGSLPAYSPRYVAPSLKGIWASAPYFHNGSVPTVRDVLFPKERPKIWKVNYVNSVTTHARTGYNPEYDDKKLGLKYETFTKIPASDSKDIRTLRDYYDTGRLGHSNSGHDFVESIPENEREAILEYLKTL